MGSEPLQSGTPNASGSDKSHAAASGVLPSDADVLGLIAGELLHEISNEFTVINYRAECALKLTDLAPQVRLALDASRAAANRISCIANALLQSVRQNNQFAFSESCDVGEIVRRAALSVHATDPIYHPEIVVVGSEQTRAAIPGVLLEHVVLNLMLNARAASKDGNHQITVEYRSSESTRNGSSAWNIGGANVEILVADRGAGFVATVTSERHHVRAPRRFGLSVCQRLLATVRGSIKLMPNPQGGTIARVLVPAATQAPAASSSAA